MPGYGHFPMDTMFHQYVYALEWGMIDLRRSPLKAHHEAGDAHSAEEATNVVDLPQNMTSGVLFRETRRVLVGEDAK